MIEKLAATFVACVVLVCSMVTSDAFVHQSMHRAPQSPIAGRQTRWESRKGESGDRSKSEDTRKAQLARIETTALKSKARTPWVPWAMDLEGNTRRVGVVLHLSHEEGEKVEAEQEIEAKDISTQRETATPEKEDGTEGTHQASSTSGTAHDPDSSRGRDANTGFFFVPHKETSHDVYSVDHQASDGLGFNRGPSLTLPYFPADVPAPPIEAEAGRDDIEDREPFSLAPDSTPFHPRADSVQGAEQSIVGDYVAEVNREALSDPGPPRTACDDRDDIRKATAETASGDDGDMAALKTTEEDCLVDADIMRAYHDALSGREPRPAADGGKHEICEATTGATVSEGIDPSFAGDSHDVLSGRVPRQPTGHDDEDEICTARARAVALEDSGDMDSFLAAKEPCLVDADIAQAYHDALSGREPRPPTDGGQRETCIATAGAVVPGGSEGTASLTPEEKDSLVDAYVAQAFRDALSGRGPRRTAFVGMENLREGTAAAAAVPEDSGEMGSMIPAEEKSLVEALVAQAIRDALSGRGPRRSTQVRRGDIQTARAGTAPEGCGDTASMTPLQGKEQQTADTLGQTSGEDSSSQDPSRTAGKPKRLKRWWQNVKDRWAKRRPPK